MLHTQMTSRAQALLLGGACLLGGLFSTQASAQDYNCGTVRPAVIQKRCIETATTTTPAPSNTPGNANTVEAFPCRVNNGLTNMPANRRTVEVNICSAALGRRVGVRVTLPANYYSPTHAPAPILYLLHGATIDGPIAGEYNYVLWSDRTDVEDTTYNTDALIVMPEGGDVGWYSDWRTQPTVNSKVLLQKWESFFFDELVKMFDDNVQFKTNKTRVIAGLSMGGMGAVSLATRRPQTQFRAAASFSGALSTRANYLVMQGGIAAKALDGNYLWGNPNSYDPAQSDWALHNPKELVSKLVNLPVWVGSGNGAGNDPVEFVAWGMSTDYANAQSSANNIARNNAIANQQPLPTGYVVRDMGVVNPSTGINEGCTGKHNWANWTVALKRAWPFLRSHLLASGSTVPPAPVVPACGVVP